MKKYKIIIQVWSFIIVFLSSNFLISIGSLSAKDYGEKKRPAIEHRQLGAARDHFEKEKKRIMEQAEQWNITFMQARIFILEERTKILEKTKQVIYEQKLQAKIEIKLELKLSQITHYPEETQILIYDKLLLKIKQKQQWSEWKRALILKLIYDIIIKKKNNL